MKQAKRIGLGVVLVLVLSRIIEAVTGEHAIPPMAQVIFVLINHEIMGWAIFGPSRRGSSE